MKTIAPSVLENIAEEQMVLGRVLHNEAAYHQVAEVLRPEHFTREIHQKIYAAYRDIIAEGKKVSLKLLQARVGDEYGEGQSTMTAMTALLRNAENGDLEGVEVLVDLWKRRQHLAELKRALKEAENPNTHVDDLMADHEQRFHDIGENSVAVPIRSIGEVVASAMAKSERTKDSGVIPGDDTGLASLDEIMGRIHPGDLGFIGSDPGAGKTILAQQIAHHIAGDRGRTVAFFQLEMQAEDMGRRYLAGQAFMSTAEVEEGAYDFDQLEKLSEATSRVRGQPFYLDDRPDLTVDQIAARCMTLKRQKNLRVCIIDHLLKIEATGNFKDYFAKTKYVTNRLKTLAKQEEIAIICLAHRTRTSQRSGPKPRISDFDGGTSIERDADWVLGMTRPDVYLEDERPYDLDSAEGRKWSERMQAVRNTLDIYGLKGRRVARGAMRSFRFDGRLSRISEIER